MDLFEILIALAVILFGLFGGGKKKSPPPVPEAQRRRTPAPSPTGRPTAAKSAPPAAKHKPLAEVPAFSYDESHEREVVSLETLEGAGEASHARFHQKYSSPLAVAVHRATSAARPPGGIRAAVVWAEILGPPKSLT